MRRLFRSLHGRLKLGGWIALCLVASTALWLPQLLSSRFVADRRAALRMEQVQMHLGSGEFEQARGELRAALRLQPDNPGARRQLAELELRLGNWELAFLEFQSLTETHPEISEGWIGLASQMVRSGLLEAPEAALDRAIAIAPQRADAHWQRGEIRFRLGRYYGAHLDAQAAVELAPSHVGAWVLLVRSAARLDAADAAIAAANRGIAAVGQDPALLLPLARLQSEQGRTSEAVKILEPIAASASASARGAQLALAGVKLRAGDREGARRQVQVLVEQQPVDEEALALRALIDARSGHVQPSLAQLDAAVQMLPMSRTLRVVRARLQSARDDPATIAALLGEMTATELGPAPAPPGRLRGDAGIEHGQLAALPRERWPGRLAQMRQALEVELRQQNWAEAQHIVESARRTYPGTAFAAWLAGIVELARGNAEQAEGHLHEALAAAPRSPMILVGLAKTWSRKKGAAFAADQLVQVAERDPAFGFARYLAARAYVDARNPAQAEATLKRGLELQAASPLPYLHLASHYLDLELAPEALATCRQGLSRFPHDLELRMMLAQISADMGSAGEAIRIYEETLSARPDLDLLVYRLAMLLASQDDDSKMWAHSMQMARALQSDRPSDPVLLDTLGWVHLRAGDARRARDLLEAAVRGAPDNPTMQFHLATLYAREKKMDLARRQLRTALESSSYFPQRMEALRLLREIGG